MKWRKRQINETWLVETKIKTYVEYIIEIRKKNSQW